MSCKNAHLRPERPALGLTKPSPAGGWGLPCPHDLSRQKIPVEPRRDERGTTIESREGGREPAGQAGSWGHTPAAWAELRAASPGRLAAGLLPRPAGGRVGDQLPRLLSPFPGRFYRRGSLGCFLASQLETPPRAAQKKAQPPPTVPLKSPRRWRHADTPPTANSAPAPQGRSGSLRQPHGRRKHPGFVIKRPGVMPSPVSVPHKQPSPQPPRCPVPPGPAAPSVPRRALGRATTAALPGPRGADRDPPGPDPPVRTWARVGGPRRRQRPHPPPHAARTPGHRNLGRGERGGGEGGLLPEGRPGPRDRDPRAARGRP